MKKLILCTAAVLAVLACQKAPAVDNSTKPTVEWDANTTFSEMEISESMNAVVTVKFPEKVSAFRVSLTTLPVELIGVANQIISTSANKASGSKAGVLDLLEDASAAQKLQQMGFAGVVGANLKNATSCKLDFAKLIAALSSGTPLDNQTKFSFTIDVVDNAGNKLSKNNVIRFNWTSAPDIVSDFSFPYTLSKGTTEKLVLNIDAQGKIGGITLQYEGDGDPGIQAWIKNRNNNSTLIDLMAENTATAFGLPKVADLKDKVNVALDLTSFMTNCSYEVTKKGTTLPLTVKVVDNLGKEVEFSFAVLVPLDVV